MPQSFQARPALSHLGLIAVHISSPAWCLTGRRIDHGETVLSTIHVRNDYVCNLPAPRDLQPGIAPEMHSIRLQLKQ